LKRHGVRFLLIVAHALAAHGRPRYTQDLDVLVDPTPANARRVSAAIAEFGFEDTARDWRWFAEPYHITPETFGQVTSPRRIFSPVVDRLGDMTSLRGKIALVIGGSSGVGKATVQALIGEGVRVTAVARGAERLRALAAEVGDGVATLRGDAADRSFAERLLPELRPDLVVHAAGVTPPMGYLDELDWDAFSETWNGDLKASFLLVKQALTLPLSPGSTVVLVSSGAAIAGSPLSGGYAGAKRMQWLLAGYAQKVSDARKLGIRTLAVLPKQLIEGTAIAARASAAYGAINGITAEAFMKRFDVPLGPDQVASAILGALRGEVAAGVHAIAVTGTGIEPLT
jgi:NAD(P)-dependent dehydrogenase (short-subunit alcohol dehydrogenase family)